MFRNILYLWEAAFALLSTMNLKGTYPAARVADSDSTATREE